MLKTTTVLLLVAATALSAPVADFTALEVQTLWTSFKQTHSKFYSLEEDAQRFALFQERVQMVQEHNVKYARGESSYAMKLTPVADWTYEEMMARNGYRQRDATSRNIETVRHVFVDGAAPDSVDWRSKGYVTDVKDQGQCGSCWSFGTTGTLEGAWVKAGNKLTPFSEQNLVDCDRAWDAGCNGGLPEVALEYVIKNGIESEADYPYKGRQGKCQFDKSKVAGRASAEKKVPADDEDALKNSVATVGPIAVGIDASHFSFQLYSHGVYDESRCSSTRLDHAVLVVGYGTENGKDYWLVKNSWSTRWGDEGYVKIARNKNNHCGVATQATYPTL